MNRFYNAGLDRVLHDLLESSSQAEGLAVQAESRARWYMLLRQPDEAVRSLETAVQARVFDVIYLGVDPIFDPIRNRPAFQSLLKKLGLAP